MKQILLALFIIYGELISAQQIKGTVYDDDGDDVPYATLTVKETKEQLASDKNGNFSLEKKVNPPFQIIVKSVGYKDGTFNILEIPQDSLKLKISSDNIISEVTVTSRRRSEQLQNVPIPISVVSGQLVEEAGAFNVNRLKELIPSVQLYSSNPRNTGLSIRGLGTTFGLTNDGIDPGVGFYVDGIYYARSAATTLDFIDVDRIEVLRGPQGTLFGKNTVAGAFNVITRKPEFNPRATAELSYGNYGYIQGKASITGPLTKKLAARISFSGTQRDGTLYSTRTQQMTNDLNNLGFRGQLLFQPSNIVDIRLIGDITRQRPNGYAQVYAGTVKTQRANYRQFESILADLGYELPSKNPFDRIIDHDTQWQSNQDLGGLSANVDLRLGRGTITSTSAWRYWNWDPSNDRDFTGLQGLALSQAPSRQEQWSQEIRWVGDFTQNLSAVAGLFAFGQILNADPAHIEEAGIDQWRFSKNSDSELWETQGLFEGYGIRSYPTLKTFSGAFFTQVDWEVLPGLNLLPGIRVNYDDKSVNFRRKTYGGLQTDDPELLALKKEVYSDQSFESSTDKTDISGQITVSFKPTPRLHTFVTVSTGFKPVGLNLGGLPNRNGQPMLELATIKPERVRHYEFGLKSQPIKDVLFNLTLYNTDVQDYQAQVQAADLSVNRGYLANAEKVRVRGIEIDARTLLHKNISIHGSLAYTDGKYISFKNAPVPLEETGSQNFKDISGGRLPGISKWVTSFGAELTSNSTDLIKQKGKLFLAVDGYYRSEFSSSPSPSAYLNVGGYTLLNARIGFRSQLGISFFIWSRNIANVDYFEQLLPGAGNVGHYAAVLGDPRTFGMTLKFEVQ